MESNKPIKRACLSGLIDSDFCLRFKKGGKYPNISASFPLYCKNLIKSIRIILLENYIKPALCVENIVDKRYNPPKFYKIYKIDINGKNNLNRVMKYMKIKNPVHLTKYAIWQKTGCCLKNTTLSERTNILALVAQW